MSTLPDGTVITEANGDQYFFTHDSQHDPVMGYSPHLNHQQFEFSTLFNSNGVVSITTSNSQGKLLYSQRYSVADSQNFTDFGDLFTNWSQGSLAQSKTPLEADRFGFDPNYDPLQHSDSHSVLYHSEWWDGITKASVPSSHPEWEDHVFYDSAGHFSGYSVQVDRFDWEQTGDANHTNFESESYVFDANANLVKIIDMDQSYQNHGENWINNGDTLTETKDLSGHLLNADVLHYPSKTQEVYLYNFDGKGDIQKQFYDSLGSLTAFTDFDSQWNYLSGGNFAADGSMTSWLTNVDGHGTNQEQHYDSTGHQTLNLDFNSTWQTELDYTQFFYNAFGAQESSNFWIHNSHVDSSSNQVVFDPGYTLTQQEAFYASDVSGSPGTTHVWAIDSNNRQAEWIYGGNAYDPLATFTGNTASPHLLVFKQVNEFGNSGDSFTERSWIYDVATSVLHDGQGNLFSQIKLNGAGAPIYTMTDFTDTKLDGTAQQQHFTPSGLLDYAYQYNSSKKLVEVDTFDRDANGNLLLAHAFNSSGQFTDLWKEVVADPVHNLIIVNDPVDYTEHVNTTLGAFDYQHHYNSNGSSTVIIIDPSIGVTTGMNYYNSSDQTVAHLYRQQSFYQDGSVFSDVYFVNGTPTSQWTYNDDAQHTLQNFRISDAAGNLFESGDGTNGGTIFNARTNQVLTGSLSITAIAKASNGALLIGNDSASLITNDGSSLIGNDGSSLIANDGSSLIGNDSASLIGSDSAGFTNFTAAGQFLRANPGYAQISTNFGSLVNTNGGNLGLTLGIVAAGAGNIVAAGAGNIVAAGAGNIVATGGGNIVAAGAGNIVATGGGNIVAAGAGNIVAAGGGNIVATGGGNIAATGGGR